MHFLEGVTTSCEVRRMRVQPKSHSPTMTWLWQENALLPRRDFWAFKKAFIFHIPFYTTLWKTVCCCGIVQCSYGIYVIQPYWKWWSLSAQKSYGIHEIMSYNPIENDEAFQLKNLSSTFKRSVLSKKFKEQKDSRTCKFPYF